MFLFFVKNSLFSVILRLSEDHIPLIMSQAKARAKPKLATTFQASISLLPLKKSSFKMLTGQSSVVFLIRVSAVGGFGALEFSLRLASLTCNFPFLTI